MNIHVPEEDLAGRKSTYLWSNDSDDNMDDPARERHSAVGLDYGEGGYGSFGETVKDSIDLNALYQREHMHARTDIARYEFVCCCHFCTRWHYSTR
jgi:hypothetical protein